MVGRWLQRLHGIASSRRTCATSEGFSSRVGSGTDLIGDRGLVGVRAVWRFQCNVLHALQVKGLQLLVVVSVLASLKDHRAEHEQGDNEDDEPLPDHGNFSVCGHEAREFLEPVLDEDDLRWNRTRPFGVGVLLHEKALAVRGDIIDSDRTRPHVADILLSIEK